jgi:hypothetical protein
MYHRDSLYLRVIKIGCLDRDLQDLHDYQDWCAPHSNQANRENPMNHGPELQGRD